MKKYNISVRTGHALLFFMGVRTNLIGLPVEGARQYEIRMTLIGQAVQGV